MTQRAVVNTTSLLFLLVAVASFIYASTAPKGVNKAGVGLTSFLLFMAAGLVGAFGGFLLGLPRSRYVDEQNKADSTPLSRDSERGANDSGGPKYASNSNFVKVSDWLTTIIVGLGLVNLGSLVPAVRDLGRALREPLGGTSYASVYGVSLVLSGFIAGLLLIYLWISIQGRRWFEESETEFREDDLRKFIQDVVSSGSSDRDSGKHQTAAGDGGVQGGPPALVHGRRRGAQAAGAARGDLQN